MSEKTLREACEAVMAFGVMPYHGDESEETRDRRHAAEFELDTAIRRPDGFCESIQAEAILAALDAEAAQADAAGYERGRREALEEVRAWLSERIALAVLDDEAATEENEDMCMAALEEIQHAREDFIRRILAGKEPTDD